VNVATHLQSNIPLLPAAPTHTSTLRLPLDIQHERLLVSFDHLGSSNEFGGRKGVVRSEGGLEEGLIG